MRGFWVPWNYGSKNKAQSLRTAIELVDPECDEYKDPDFNRLAFSLLEVGHRYMVALTVRLLERIAFGRLRMMALRAMREMDSGAARSLIPLMRKHGGDGCPFYSALMMVCKRNIDENFIWTFEEVARKIGWRESRLIALKYLRRLEESGELDAVQVAASFKDI